MKTFQYRLEKAEYLDWIRWEIAQRDNPGGKKKMLLLLLLIVAAILGIELLLFRDKPEMVLLSAGFGLVILVGFSGMTSDKNKTRALWIQSGLDQVEKANAYPTMSLTLQREGFTLTSDRDERTPFYRYRDIMEIIEREHIIMVMTGDQKWQFIANKAFRDASEKGAVLRLFQSKGEPEFLEAVLA